MVRFLLSLTLFLSLLILRSNNVFAQNAACYCVYPNNDGRCYANTTCWACAPGAYAADWQSQFCLGYQAPITQVVTCTYSAQTETRSCPINYSGAQTWKKETNCPSGSYGQSVQTDWFKIQDTCVQNPPTCQVSSQQQSLSCSTGYTGSISQTRSSTCPDPYGSPVWQPWATISNNCKKSVDNPTNPVSPVNPASPVNPTSTISAPTIQSSPVIVSTPNTVPNSEPMTQTESQISTDGSSAPSAGSPATQTPAQPDAKSSQKESSSTKSTSQPSTPKGKTQSAVGLVLSLELYLKPGLTQANVFPDLNIVKGIPNEILMHDQTLMGLMFQPTIRQPNFEVPDLGFEQ